MDESFGTQAYQASNNPPHGKWADAGDLWLAFVGITLGVSVPTSVVVYGVYDFFYRPYNWSTFKYMDSPFDTFRKSPGLSKASKAFGWAGHAYSAYEVGLSYHEGGKQGVIDYLYETWKSDIKLILPWSRPLIDLLD
jgi:hypothetical protein